MSPGDPSNFIHEFLQNTSRNSSRKCTRGSFRKPIRDSLQFSNQTSDSICRFLKKLPENPPLMLLEIYSEWLSGSFLCFYFSVIFRKISSDNPSWIINLLRGFCLKIFQDAVGNILQGFLQKPSQGIPLEVFAHNILLVSFKKPFEDCSTKFPFFQKYHRIASKIPLKSIQDTLRNSCSDNVRVFFFKDSLRNSSGNFFTHFFGNFSKDSFSKSQISSQIASKFL